MCYSALYVELAYLRLGRIQDFVTTQIGFCTFGMDFILPGHYKNPKHAACFIL